jgi:protein-disulfide isomerase
VLGKADAAVTVIEYASFTCPHCAAFNAEVMPKLKAEYVETGKVKFIYRDFPLDGAALRAAQVARCRGPESFFGFVDVLFTQQRAWANQQWQDNLKRLARLGGVSEDQFNACIADKTLENFVLQQRMEGDRQFKITGTPTIVVNGKNVGSPTFEELKKAIDPLVKG